jgi:hypothetical protein
MRVIFLEAGAWVLLALLWMTSSGGAAEMEDPGLDPSMPLRLEPDRTIGDMPIEVHLVNFPAEARIRFTTDGTEPSLQNGQDYRAPWRLTQSTILKVAAFANGRALSRSTTHSYLSLDDVLNQPARPKGYPHGGSAWQGEPAYYGKDPRVVKVPWIRQRMKAALRALPTVSLVSAPKDLFGLQGGLYLNSQARGDGWERRCSLEWIETNGLSGFQVDCGFRIQGNTGRRADKTPKHSFRVLFKKTYGLAKLRYPVFPDSPVSRFDSLVLRADYNNAWTHWKPEDNERAQRIRDSWLKDSHRAMGYLSGHNRYVHLYLNGLYWGIYDVAERPDASFAAAYLGGEKEDYDVLDDSGIKSGSSESLRDYKALSRISRVGAMERVGQQLDLQHFMDYLLLNFYAGNQDWGEYQNWYVIRGRGLDSRFRHYVWDGEITLQSLRDDVVNQPDRPPMVLGRRLAQDPEYRLAFADRVQKHCFGTGALTPEASSGRWQRRASELELPLLAESARWGYCRRDPPYTLEDWSAERARLLGEYFPKRTQVLLRQLRSAGLYPKVVAPRLAFRPNLENGSQLKLILGAEDLAGGVVYLTTDGTDPRVPGKGEPSPSAKVYQDDVFVTTPLAIKARTLLGTNWSALVEVVSPIR